jgi:hypothetical protein
MAAGSLLDILLQLGEQRIVTVDQRQVHRHVFLHAAVIEALEETATVLGLGDAAQRFAEVVLTGRILNMRV